MNPLKTFFYSFKNSLFKPKYYQDIVKTNFWFSFKYLWFLLFLLTIIKTFVLAGLYLKNRPLIQPKVNKLMIYAENFYPKELKLQIKNGQLSTNVKEPYIFEIEKNQAKNYQKHFLVIDTQGSIENYPSYSTNILATKNAVVYPSKSSRNQVGETSVFYFRDLKRDFTLDKGVYNSFINIIRPYSSKVNYFVDWIVLSISPLFMIFGSLLWVVGVMFGLLFLTFFVWVLNLIFKKRYSYGSLFRMGMHAVTWPILTTEVMRYIRPPYPSYYVLIFFVWMFIILSSFEKNNKKL